MNTLHGKALVLPLVLMMALSVTGVAAAHWSDTFSVSGTVAMGTCTIAFHPKEILSYVDNEQQNVPPKDIGWAEIYYQPESYIVDPHSNKDGYKKLEFVIHNAYPQYEVHFTTVRIANIGTIPVHFIGLDIRDPTGVLNWQWTTPPPAHETTGFFWKDFNGNGAYDPGEEIMNITIVNFICTQLEPCDSTKGEVDIDFKQPAEECHTYQFEIEITAIQWNKA
ncbi:MAG: hypothetical protein QXJ75_05320 [Candidatus Bathyarchaeia archaeon]